MPEREIERERLIELIDDSNVLQCCGCHYNSIDYYKNKIVDYLLSNGVIVPNNKLINKLKLNRNRYIEMIDTYLEEPHSISREWVELLRIMREIIEGAENDES